MVPGVALMSAGTVLGVIYPAGDLDLGAGPTSARWRFPGTDGVVNALATPYNIALGVLGLLAVASLFLRLRGADAERRHQVRWVAYAGGLALVIYESRNLVLQFPIGCAVGIIVVGVMVAGSPSRPPSG